MKFKLLSVAAAVFCSVLFLPSVLRAQEATVVGTITDATNAVLPGVTVTALKIDNGNTFVDVSDGAGNYRLSLRPGIYKLTAELTGFTPAVRGSLELQIGQRAVIDLKLTLSSVTESVTVTGATPMIEVSQSKLGGNIDRRQVEELPVNGRNFVDLSMLAKGSRSNAVIESSDPRNNAGAGSQINVDGQEVTQTACCQDSFGNPRYSKDSIAEFEVITNRFDATQGHSMGSQLNAISKSGTNRFSGGVSGYFRSDQFNAADHVVNRVLPYQDQQISTTFGGPLIKNRLHFFGNYEYERTPNTFVFNTPYPSFNKEDLLGTESLYTSGVKVDYQLNPQTHATMKGYRFHRDIPILTAGGSTQTVSSANAAAKASDSIFGSLVQTFGSKAVNEVKGGYNSYYSLTIPYVEGEKFKDDFWYQGAPRVDLNGISFGGPANTPQRWIESRYTVRDDLTVLFSKKGRHEIKLGGEFLHNNINLIWNQLVRGILNATGGAIPALIEQIIPDQHNFRTWNLAALSPISLRWSQSFGPTYLNGPADITSAWAQDNWTINPRLTLNLGVRYEYAHNQLNEEAVLAPFLPAPRKAETLNFTPRIGGAYNFNGGKTVIRGGSGKYLAQSQSQPHWGTNISVLTRVPSTNNDGRANFAADPYNGRTPTLAEVFARVNDTANAIVDPNIQLPYSWQSSIGAQHQINETMSFEADYVYQAQRAEFQTRNMNLSYNPVTGINNPYTTVALRPFPNWGIVNMLYSDGLSNYHGLQTALNKRFSKRWQATATYTLSGIQDMTQCGFEGLGRQIVNCPRDMGGELTYATTDQRHRATVNGIWSLPYDFQFSGLYFYGSGARFNTVYGGDRRLQGAGQSGRLGPNGVIATRNNLVGKPLHRVDIRVLKRVKLGGGMQLDGILEVFNLFDHANFGSYSTNLSVPATYGLPVQNSNVAYQPRIVQLGFRFTF